MRPEGDVSIASYINNLHPQKYNALYGTIEAVIQKTIPLWEYALTEIFKKEHPPSIASIPEVTHGFYLPRIHVKGMPEWAIDEPIMPCSPELIEHDDGTIEEASDYGDYGWRKEGLVQPERTRKSYEARRQLYEETKPVNLRRDFHTKTLQVIVKLANIHLTPDDPQYNGGT